MPPECGIHRQAALGGGGPFFADIGTRFTRLGAEFCQREAEGRGLEPLKAQTESASPYTFPPSTAGSAASPFRRDTSLPDCYVDTRRRRGNGFAPFKPEGVGTGPSSTPAGRGFTSPGRTPP